MLALPSHLISLTGLQGTGCVVAGKAGPRWWLLNSAWMCHQWSLPKVVENLYHHIDLCTVRAMQPWVEFSVIKAGADIVTTTKKDVSSSSATQLKLKV